MTTHTTCLYTYHLHEVDQFTFGRRLSFGIGQSQRLGIYRYGYCDSCASDVLHFVASIFARGDVKEQR